MSDLWSRYQAALAEKSLLPDPAQEEAVQVLDALFHALKNPKKKRFNFFRIAKSLIQSPHKSPHKSPKGLYLYGPVGRGKTMLMDLFLTQLRRHNITAERWHFHAFMLKIHQDLRDLADIGSKHDLDSRIEILAEEWMKRTTIICFDEFHITDVADAMIMMPLFTTLFQRGMVLLTTSNWAPQDLYSGGLQRQRFLPFIDILTRYMQVVNVSGTIDYRSRKRENAPSWLTPLDEESEQKFDLLFRDMIGYDPIETHEIHVGTKEQGHIGRTWVIPFASKQTAKINLHQFLSQPLGAADFIALADRYPFLFLDELHAFSEETNDKAKRFMVMIDIFYDRGIKLAIRAQVEVENLYPQTGGLSFEFSRTISRLREMTAPLHIAQH